ncbi:MAG TPA: tetratricopeptide repeat protein [Streptosporangiaceae bacterium]|nr:tetratricopeptide repeat protein [Streptosporangiaceae bacterium]
MDTYVTGLSAAHAADQREIWPLQSGPLPALADNYCARTETGIALGNAPVAGEILVLAGPVPSDALGPTGTGGTGKTQLATAAALELMRTRSADLLIWVNASSRDAVLTGYARALADLQVAELTTDLESAGPMMIEWLASASRPWLVVLDDVTDARDLTELWPQGARRRVLVTARSATAMPPGQSVRVREIGPLSHRESVNYLTAALKEDPDLRLGAPDLAADMEGLPVGLAFAVAVITDRRVDCRDYRAMLAERRQLLARSPAGRWPLTVTAAWSLAVDRVTEIVPGALAWRALAFSSMLDSEGAPAAVIMSDAACRYLTDRPEAPLAENQAYVRGVLGVLARLGLLTLDRPSRTHTIRMHAQIQQAVMSYISAEYRDQAGSAAADALLEAWPAVEGSPESGQRLRACAARLREVTGDLLWIKRCHPVLAQAGESLSGAGLTRSAASYWQALLTADSALLGNSHPDTILARGNLADSYERAGQPENAIGLYEEAFADSEQVHGPDSAETLTALGRLSAAYLAAGRSGEAIALHRRNLETRERAHGPRHHDTIAARARLADCCLSAGQHKEAVDLYTRILADRERIQGSRHPDTMAARASLAFAYRSAGRMKEAIPAYQRVLADREQTQGAHHPDTLAARGNLASAYHSAGRMKEAIPVYERTLTDWEQLHGPRDPHTLTARGNLAGAYHSARRLADAIPIYERTIADCGEVLGHVHPDTLTLRSNLGLAYHTVGRLSDAIAIFESTLADSEQALGPDHPLTQTARENLQAVASG